METYTSVEEYKRFIGRALDSYLNRVRIDMLVYLENTLYFVDPSIYDEACDFIRKKEVSIMLHRQGRVKISEILEELSENSQEMDSIVNEALDFYQCAHRAPAESSAEVPAESSVEAPAESSAEVPAESSAESSVEIPVEALAESSAEVPAESSAEVPAESSAEVPAESSVEVPAESSAEVPAESSVEIPVEALAESSVESSAESSVEVPAESSDEVPAESSVEVPAESSVEVPAESSVEVPANNRVVPESWEDMTSEEENINAENRSIDSETSNTSHSDSNAEIERLSNQLSLLKAKIEKLEKNKSEPTRTTTETSARSSYLEAVEQNREKGSNSSLSSHQIVRPPQIESQRGNTNILPQSVASQRRIPAGPPWFYTNYGELIRIPVMNTNQVRFFPDEMLAKIGRSITELEAYRSLGMPKIKAVYEVMKLTPITQLDVDEIWEKLKDIPAN